MNHREGIPHDEAIPMLAEALPYNDEADVQRWFSRYALMVGHAPLVYASTIEDVRTLRKVPNEPFRDAYLRSLQPEILGVPHKPWNSSAYRPDYNGASRFDGSPSQPERKRGDFHDLFAEEIKAARVRNPGLRIGPGDLSASRVCDFLRDVLGVKPRRAGNQSITLAWLLQYEVAEALCKTLGLIPYTVGI